MALASRSEQADGHGFAGRKDPQASDGQSIRAQWDPLQILQVRILACSGHRLHERLASPAQGLVASTADVA